MTYSPRQSELGCSPQLGQISQQGQNSVLFGYNPDAAGSYHPDPEDYPPLYDDADGVARSGDVLSGAETEPIRSSQWRQRSSRFSLLILALGGLGLLAAVVWSFASNH